MEELYGNHSTDLPEDPIYDEDGHLVAIEHNVPCPLCRQNIGR